MSITLIVYCMLCIILACASFTRPIYAVSLYMLTYFLSPPLWWWGDPIHDLRVNLISGFVLLAASLSVPPPVLTGRARKLLIVGYAMLANMVIVHVLFGVWDVSYPALVDEFKFILLTYLIVRTVRTTGDFRILVVSIMLGAGYVGYECCYNERGYIEDNRLEGVGCPGAADANHFASLMISVLPLAAPLLLAGRVWHKLIAAIAAPLILDVVLLCNSRGAFLAAINSCFVFIYSAPKGLRIRSYKYFALGLVALFLLLGDARIVDRFMTTFTGEEGRDASAQSRIDNWKCGIEMIKDYPLGAGGYAFKKIYGRRYLAKAGLFDGPGSVHNGYLNEACCWGIQGLILRLIWFYLATRICFQSIRRSPMDVNKNEFLLISQVAVVTGLAAFAGTAMFSSLLDAEWGYWFVALAVCSARIQDLGNDQTAMSENDFLPLGTF